ncbi:unnamed protein product [Parnassius apollo]|uniref:(apollo) hypothetical protein n=1 Tax=Parnassius apollo TaxID=110799 RepID=A0A8S3X823_PARAO|nr:unnamed protein product [Parnassius apollo]
MDNRLTSEAIYVLNMESRRRRELDDETIGNLLEDSDIGDFVPSDDDFDDPEFVRPESSMSSTEGESD